MHVEYDVLAGWLHRDYKRNGWRMRSWSDEDFIQEGLCMYLTVERHYSTPRGTRAAVTEPKHLMALFKTSWSNHVHDRSRKEYVSAPADGLLALEATASINTTDVNDMARAVSGDAQALLTLFCAPGEAITDSIAGIVFTAKQLKVLAHRLGITAERVRSAAAELHKEFITMPSNIDILATHSGTPVQPNEEREAYLRRLVEAVASLSQSAWDALPSAAQSVHNAMATAYSNGTPLVDSCPDAAPPKAPAARTPATSKAKPVVGARVKKHSPTSRAREIMVLDETIRPSDVVKRMREEGIEPPGMSTLQAMRSETRSVLDILREHNRLAAPTELAADPAEAEPRPDLKAV